MPMWNKIGRRLLRRLLLTAFVVAGSITLVFFVTRVLPADPALALSGPDPTEEMIAATRQLLGLDRPLGEQFITYWRGLLQGDLGRSALTGQSITYEMGARLPATIELVIVSLSLAIVASFSLAILAARKPGGWWDRITAGIALIGTALPSFVVGVLLVWVFYTSFSIAPAPLGRLPTGVTPPPAMTHLYIVDSIVAKQWNVLWAALKQMALPAVTLAINLIPPLVKVLRNNMVEALTSDSLVALRFVPMGRLRRWLRYVLPLAVVPTLTLLAASFGSLVGGTVVVEHIFAWNGIGSYIMQGISIGDYNVVQGVVLISSLAYSIAYLVVDIIAWLIDPRLLEDDYAQTETH